MKRRLHSQQDNASTECECGEPKRRADLACRRCLWLDGRSEAEGRLIAVLRLLSGPTSLVALALEAGLSDRQLLRTVKRLVRRRRLRKLIAGQEVRFGRRTGEAIPATYILAERQVSRRAARAA